MQLFFMEDQYMIQALSPDTPQKALTDGISARCVIRCFENLNATCCCHASKTGPKLTIIIANEVLRRLSIGSRLPQLLCGPSVGRKSCHTHVDDFPRFQFDDEEGKERTEQEISDLQEITGPHISSVIMQEGRPLLPSRER